MNFMEIIVLNIICISYLFITYYRFLQSDFYEYVNTNKAAIFPPLSVIFYLYICGYISLLQGVYRIYIIESRRWNIFVAYYILQLCVNVSSFLIFYELNMVRLTIVMSNISLYIIIYFVYLWRIVLINKYVSFYFFTSYINSLLYYCIMRSKLNDNYKKPYEYHYII